MTFTFDVKELIKNPCVYKVDQWKLVLRTDFRIELYELWRNVLDLAADKLEVSIDRTDNFSIVLPDNEMFNNFDLTIDQSEDIKKVETGEDSQ